MKKILLLPLLLLSTLFASAQTRSLQGRVVSATNQHAVSKASIMIKDGKSFITDDSGHFKIEAPSGAFSLTASSIGFASQEVAINAGDNNIIIQLAETDKSLGEVVVVGYSDKKKGELTSAVAVVDAGKLKDVTTNDVGSMLQGKVAGLQVVNSSGLPGASAEIRLRGISSINASQSPLYVVDGIIGGNFDPNDVESITVLKDASATAMYGSQANAGVIVVTTKKAKTDKTSFEFKATTGFRTPDFGNLDMMNGEQLYNYQKEFYRDYIPGDSGNSYKIDLLKFYDERPRELQYQNNNWMATIFSPAFMQNYYISISGKTQKNDYYFGASYYNEDGTFKNTKYQRLNLRASSTLHFSPKVSLTNTINISGITGKSYDYNDIYYAYLNMPWDDPYDSTGQPVYVDGNSTFKWWSRDKINPLHTIDHSNHPYKSFDVNYDLNFNYQITNWLTFSSTNRIGASYGKSTNYYSAEVAGQYNGTGYLDESSTLNYSGISNDLLKFSFRFGEHQLSGLAGVAFEGGKTETLGATGRGLPFNLSVLNVVSSNLSVSGYNDRSALVSYISQVNYSYKNRYFLTGSYRIDGSTAFQESKRYGSFPAISAGWLVSNEGFLKNNPVIDLLKIRAGFGITGTQDIGASRYLGLYSLTSQYNSESAATPSQLPSPNLTWESKYQTNVGVDISFFKHVSLSVDLYRNLTKNLLLQVSQPLSVGFETRWENSGEIENKGLEITLSTINIQSKNFTWSTDFNISFNTNTLQKLPASFVKTGATWSISQIYRNGGNLYEFYMPVWKGVDPQTGAPLWEVVTKDADGNVTARETTSSYANATYQEAGSALPKGQGGFTNTFTYKNFSLSANLYFLYGNKVFSNALRFVMNDGNEPYYNQIVLPKGYSIWTKPGDIATNPSPQNAANSTETSTRYLQNGSYLSIRNITLGYNLPQSFATRLGLQNIAVALSADNVYTFTKFLGQDPQTTIVSATYTTPGVSDFKYPNNHQYLLNINVKF
ncbi:SusC/RagA family TonB-linked outer membrane protein [Parafilimonas sp.]|uniref:SusC/RagA family TonB-linked outer membrane protein n=1 Tax=Parafilimonas sp. TaxID=1969739 RepID=UPI0039E48A8C